MSDKMNERGQDGKHSWLDELERARGLGGGATTETCQPFKITSLLKQHYETSQFFAAESSSEAEWVTCHFKWLLKHKWTQHLSKTGAKQSGKGHEKE